MRGFRPLVFIIILAFLTSLAALPALAQGVLPNAVQTFTGPNGAPLAGGAVYTYVPNTTTPKTTYADSALTVANTNPILLDANGQAVIWGPTGFYRQVVQDQFGDIVWDRPTFIPSSPAPGGTLLPFVTSIAELSGIPTTSTSVIQVVQTGPTGATSTTTYVKSNLPCTLNAGNGDNGSQVKSSDNKCWIGPLPNYGGGTDIKVYGPTATGKGTFTSATAVVPWTVVMPDDTQLDCSGTQANCLDKLFTAMDTVSAAAGYYNYGATIEQQGGATQGGLMGVGIASVPLTLPVLRSRHLDWKNPNIYGVSPSATSVLQIDSGINFDLRFDGGQIGANADGHNYSASTVLIKPTKIIQPEGFAATAVGTIHLPGISHDSDAKASIVASISGTTLTVSSIAGDPLAIDDQIVATTPGTTSLANTYITAFGSGTGGVGTYTVNRSQVIGAKTMAVYAQDQAALRVLTTTGNVIAVTIEGNEVNGAGHDNIPRVNGAVFVDGPTPTTGSQYVNYRFNYLHNCAKACFNMGANATNAALLQYNTIKVDQISPATVGTGASDWGHHNAWDITVDDTAGELISGLNLQSSAHDDTVHLKCKANVSGGGIDACLILSSGAVRNTVYITTEGLVPNPVVDFNVAGTGFNTIYVNGKLWQQPWTPVLAFGGATTGILYTTQAGLFTYDAGLASAEFSLELSAKGSGSGAATIVGLPYPTNASFNASCQINDYSALTAVTATPWIKIAAGGSQMQLGQAGATAFSALTDANFQVANSVLRGSCVYHTD